MEFVGSLSRFVADFITRVKQEALQDSAYNKLVDQVKEDTIKCYGWKMNYYIMLAGSYMFPPTN